MVSIAADVVGYAKVEVFWGFRFCNGVSVLVSTIIEIKSSLQLRVTLYVGYCRAAREAILDLAVI